MKNNLLLIIILSFTGLSLINCRQTLDTSESYKGRIISYIRTWELKKVNGQNIFWKADDIDGKMLTDLNIAFAVIKNGSDINIESLEWDDGFFNLFSEIQELRDKYPLLKINLSIGGWGAGGFSDMASNKNSREDFTNNVIEWVEKYGFDGIDIDWEYPVNGGGGIIKSRPEDKTNFTLLLQELKDALNTLSNKTDKTYTLSFAGAGFSDYLKWIEPSKISRIVDYVNLMTYDFYGDWTDTTGHHSNLYTSDFNSKAYSADKAVKAYLNAGFPSNKIVLGIPFFGKGWKGVENINNGLYRHYLSPLTSLNLGYDNIPNIINSKKLKRYWDDSAKAPFLYNGDIWISYDDPESVKIKTDYVKQNHLGGIMIWEYSNDLNKELLTIIYKNIKKKSIKTIR